MLSDSHDEEQTIVIGLHSYHQHNDLNYCWITLTINVTQTQNNQINVFVLSDDMTPMPRIHGGHNLEDLQSQS